MWQGAETVSDEPSTPSWNRTEPVRTLTVTARGEGTWNMDIQRVIDITAPREQVWATMADVERWPEWTDSVRSVERLDQTPFRVGSRARVRQPRLPTALWTVTALEPGRSFTWQSIIPGLTSVGVHTVDATGDRTSRVTLSITWSGLLAPVIRLLFGNLSRRYVSMEAQGLKRRCEAAQPSSPSRQTTAELG